jgi:hypothetical protein
MQFLGMALRPRLPALPAVVGSIYTFPHRALFCSSAAEGGPFVCSLVGAASKNFCAWWWTSCYRPQPDVMWMRAHATIRTLHDSVPLLSELDTSPTCCASLCRLSVWDVDQEVHAGINACIC